MRVGLGQVDQKKCRYCLRTCRKYITKAATFSRLRLLFLLTLWARARSIALAPVLPNARTSRGEILEILCGHGKNFRAIEPLVYPRGRDFLLHAVPIPVFDWFRLMDSDTQNSITNSDTLPYFFSAPPEIFNLVPFLLIK